MCFGSAADFGANPEMAEILSFAADHASATMANFGPLG